MFKSKHQANQALWSNNSPFKQKVVQNKKRYKRKEKFQKGKGNLPSDLLLA
jgi:hypothetical protein